FFQAEDGIRDRNVTGVQTCALPILDLPGSGKSTLAARLAEERPLALALDIDVLKHSLGGWDEDLTRSGLQARRLAAAMIGQHLRSEERRVGKESRHRWWLSRSKTRE